MKDSKFSILIMNLVQSRCVQIVFKLNKCQLRAYYITLSVSSELINDYA